MGNDEIKVVYDKKSLIIIVCCLSLIELACIVISVKQSHIPLGIFTAVYSFTLDFFILFPTSMFYVKANGSDIKLRTRLGRKYEFSVSDIEKVTCSETYGKNKVFSDIDIEIKQKNVSVGSEMIGFGKMAEYLLEKYESGEINAQTMSSNCRKELLRYKNKFA